MEMPDGVIISLVLLGIFLLAGYVFFVLRSGSSLATSAAAAGISAEGNIEYEWEARSRSWIVLLAVLMIAVLIVAVMVFIYGVDWRELIEPLEKFGLAVLAMVISVFSQGMKVSIYQLTGYGLVKIDKRNPKKPQVLFTWESIAWFKPDDHGFRYFLDANRDESIVGGQQAVAGSGYVPCGRNATIVNSLIMARGVPTEKPLARQ